MDSPSEDQQHRRRQLLVLSLTLATLPFLAVTFVPATDLPQHLEQIRLWAELLGWEPSTHDLDNLIARPFAGNAFIYTPMLLLSRLFAPVLLGKLTLLLIVWASVLAVHWLAQERKRSPVHALLAGVLLFGQPLHWGFLNFISGLPIFLVVLGLVLRPPQTFGPRQMLGTALLFLLLYWAHVLWLPWAAAALLLGQLQAPRELRGYLKRAVCLLPALVACALWYPALRESRKLFRTEPVYTIEIVDRLSFKHLFSDMFGGTTMLMDVVFGAVMLLYLLTGVVQSRRKTSAGSWDTPLLTIGLCMLVAWLLGPDLYMNTVLFVARLAPLGTLLLVLSAPPPSWRPLTWGAGLAATGFALLLTVYWAIYDQSELSGLREALQHKPKSVLGLDYRNRSDVINGRPFIQEFAYFGALHGSKLNFSFAEHGSSVVAFKKPLAFTYTPGLEWLPERAVIRDLKQFECTLVNATPAQHREFQARTGMRTAAKNVYFRLYCNP